MLRAAPFSSLVFSLLTGLHTARADEGDDAPVVIPGFPIGIVHDPVEIDTQAGPRPCWVVRTIGMTAVGQEELVFVLPRNPEDVFNGLPDTLPTLVGNIFLQAVRGHQVRASESILDPNLGGALGRADFTAAMFLPSESYGEILPAHHLVVIPLTAGEARLAEVAGPVRITSRLGERTRYFPAPPWWDPARPAEDTPQDGDSLVSKVSRVWEAGVSVYREPIPLDEGLAATRWQMVLEVPLAVMDRVYQDLREKPEDAGVAFLSDLDPTWDTITVWRPGQQGVHLIGTPAASGHRVGASSLLIAPGLDEPGSRLFEDGYTVFLTAGQWENVRQALARRASLTLPDPGTGDPLFSLRAILPEGPQPVHDAGQAVGGAAGTTRAGAPEDHAVEPAEILGRDALLQDRHLLRRMTDEDLRSYMDRTEQALCDSLAGLGPAPVDLILELTLLPGKPSVVRVAFLPDDPSQKVVNRVTAALSSMQAPRVSGKVNFEMHFALWGGADARE